MKYMVVKKGSGVRRMRPVLRLVREDAPATARREALAEQLAKVMMQTPERKA